MLNECLLCRISAAWVNPLIFLKALVARMDAVKATQGKLMDEVAAEGEKFGEDVKHLADFTGGIKKVCALSQGDRRS